MDHTDNSIRCRWLTRRGCASLWKRCICVAVGALLLGVPYVIQAQPEGAIPEPERQPDTQADVGNDAPNVAPDTAPDTTRDVAPVVVVPAVARIAQSPSPDQLAQAAADEQATNDARRLAAHALVRFAVEGEDGADDALVWLLNADRSMGARRVALRALVHADPLPTDTGLPDAVLAMRGSLQPELAGDWAAVLGRYELERIADALAQVAGDGVAPLEERRLAIRALGEHRQPFAAQALMDLTSINQIEQIQSWAYDALASLSHEPDLGRDRAAWAQWYNTSREMSASDWQRMLHENLMRQTRARDDIDERVRARLIQSQRALYRATAPEQRPTLLVELMRDPLDSVRTLAMDLARQAAEDNNEFGPELRLELRDRLLDELPRVREESATLLGQLLDGDAADTMAQRLAANLEREPAVQKAYLLALTQMPRADALQPAYDMLLDPVLEPSAAGMLAAAYRANQADETFWSDVSDRVHQRLEGVDSPRPQMVTLLALVIDEDNAESWGRIRDWLGADDERVREAAARAWAGAMRPLSALADRSDDPVIRPIALRAIAERGRTSQTLRAVAGRRPSEPDDVRLWEQALVAMAGRVEAAAVLQTIDSLADRNGETRPVRERMLTAAIDREDRPDPPTADGLRLLIARAQVRVLSDAPALVVLDYEAALQYDDTLTDQQLDEARRGLTRAYLADRRVNDALTQSALVLKPEGELIDEVGTDALLQELIAAAQAAVEQGRKDDAARLLTGIRTMLAQAISADLDAQLLALQAQIEREEPVDPAP